MEAHIILERRRSRRRLIFWRSVAVGLAVVLAIIVVSKTVPFERSHIARITVTGIITEDSVRTAALEQLAENEAAKAVILRINSPGGTVTGSEELFVDLRAVAKEKPLVAVIGGVGASGGYIAAVAAERIFARETSLTGSIGVLMEAVEVSSLLETLGVSVESIKSADLKGEPSPFHTLRPDVRDALQASIDDSFQWFKELVQDRRALDGAEIETVSDGSVFTGRQAVKVKLVDAVGGEREAIDWLESTHNIDGDMGIVDVEWGRDQDVSERWVAALAAQLLGLVPQLPRVLPLDGLLSIWHPPAKY